MPSGCTMPRLTKTEIKRRIATMKFPVVILGKEQINPFIEVPNYDHPQFDGLDKQIWPFMVGWDQNNQFTNEENIVAKRNVEMKDNNILLSRKYNNLPDSNLNKLRKIHNEVALNKRPNFKAKKQINSELITIKNKTELQREMVEPDINNKIQQFRKQESITNIKEKMLNLLYKKLSDKKIVDDDDYNMPKEYTKQPRLRSPIQKVDASASTEIQTKAIAIASKPKINGSPVRNQNKKSPRNGIRRGHPWAKAKWASDFIENVIKKIKNGVYYNQGINRKYA